MSIRLRPTLAALALLAATSPASAQLRLGSEFQVNTYTTGQQVLAAVAMDEGGAFVVVWEDRELAGANQSIRGQRYAADGTRLGSEFLVNTYTGGRQFVPDVAFGADGEFVVVWTSQPRAGNPMSVFGQRFDPAGGPLGSEFRVNTYTTSHQLYPSVAADADGNFVVVWQKIAQDSAILGRRFDAVGTPIDEEVQINTMTSGSLLLADVASDADGNFVVVWHSSNYGRFRIHGRRFDAMGQGLGSEFEINPSSGRDNRYATVSMDGEGDFVVAWEQFAWAHPAPHDVMAQRFDAAGAALGDAFRVNASANKYPRQPVVASDREGNFVVNWFDVTDGGHLFGREYEADGSPRTGVFRVNTLASQPRGFPAVSSAPDGDYVVVWATLDGSSEGIVGQRFGGPGLHLAADGSCPGPVTVTIAQAPPGSEVAVIAAANTNNYIKGGTLCPGTVFEIGEPFQLPPTWVIVDENGSGSAEITLQSNRCWLEALATSSCETSGAAQAQ